MEQSSDKTGAGSPSTRPYLIRALHDWCTDNGFTPYIAVHVDRFVQVPMEYVSNNEIVLNVGFDATSSLDLGNELIQFKARFGGTAREIIVPVDHVVAIYARENGQGMAFPAPEAQTLGDKPATEAATSGSAAASIEGASPAVEARANPLRALRLAPASEAGETASPTAVPQSPSGASGESNTPAGDDEPEGPAPGTGRPTLKRVK
ncbi:ClpXP protease specificity-enhancing factor [Paucibacter sp. AS339]|uniref:ClpXP protease specificity-enhancing factor n=1 Tax=Paucibacter hankyongi TaxID=3133434 RepID=UPI0030B11C97